ncbi:MAG TPA: serine hydrolase domain-containing protein, partial [Candidatus Acidoferrum sp.]|nr:serine hydrolase domain-containing protein [Candidatus Acidoferrum sp.]
MLAQSKRGLPRVNAVRPKLDFGCAALYLTRMLPGITRAITLLSLIANAVTFAATQSLDSLLEPIRSKANVPAMAAAVIRSNSIIAVGAVGVRKFGSPETVTIDDKFHIASCTKAMTATLAAIYVEQGKLSWTATIG